MYQVVRTSQRDNLIAFRDVYTGYPTLDKAQLALKYIKVALTTDGYTVYSGDPYTTEEVILVKVKVTVIPEFVAASVSTSVVVLAVQIVELEEDNQ